MKKLLSAVLGMAVVTVIVSLPTVAAAQFGAPVSPGYIPDTEVEAALAEGGILLQDPGLTIAFVDSPIMNQLSYEASNARSLARGVTYQDDLGSRVIEVLRHLQNVHAGVSTTGV